MKSIYRTIIQHPIKLLLLFGLFTLHACTDDEDDSVDNQQGISPNEEELITTLEVITRDTAMASQDTFRFRDLDGDGGNSPVVDTLNLNQNTFYEVELRFLDESDPSDVENITDEILAEDDEHLVCYTASPSSALNILRTDSDGTYELGVQSSWESFGSQSGVLQIVLKHQPGVKNGSCSPGETDIEVDFPLIIQ